MENSRERKYRYLNGLMSPEEENDFLQEVKEDPYLKDELDFELNTQKAIHRNERAQLKAFLSSIDETQKINFKRWWAVASILLVVGLSISLWFYLDSTPKNDTLFTEYFQPYPNIIAPNVRGENIEDISSEAFTNYELENYQLSARQFEELYVKTQEPYTLLYGGISYLANREPRKAIELLKKVENYSEIAEWYLALAYLQLYETDNSEKILEKLSNQESEFSETSKELLKKL